MITLAEMEERVKALLVAVENSVKDHHLLVGQAREAEQVVAFMKAKHAEIEAEAKTAIEAASNAPVEHVAEEAQESASGAIG